MSLILHDSNFQNGVTKWYHEQCAAYMNTVDRLQHQIAAGQLEIVNLQTYNPRSEIESPVWYEIKSYSEKKADIRLLMNVSFTLLIILEDIHMRDMPLLSTLDLAIPLTIL